MQFFDYWILSNNYRLRIGWGLDICLLGDWFVLSVCKQEKTYPWSGFKPEPSK
jgi:hypothetical protein